MRPDIEQFEKVLSKSGGSLSKVADVFGVKRATVYNWTKADPEFAIALKSERGKMFDACLISARLLAVGVPDIDEDGKFRGWIERPDSNMIRYLLSTLGKHEGFGEDDDSGIVSDINHGVSIDEWIKHRTND